MPPTPVVLLDCDNVLADFVGGYLKVLGSQTGRWFTPAQVTQWSIEASLGLTEDEHDAVCRMINAGGFCEALEPPSPRGAVDDAAQSARRLHRVVDALVGRAARARPRHP